ncbi:hypothetical protein BsWGS_14347 [Bradybaena similaris]
MVQFHVLRCAACQTFQVLQVTKTAKWKCKMCGLKQSVTKVYGQGSGADCRRHVQKLNSIRGQIAKTAEEQHLISAAQTPVDSGFSSPDGTFKQQETVRHSRWSSFVDDSGDEIEESSQNVININGSVVPVTTDSTEYQGTRNNWRKRKAGSSNGFSKLPGKKSKIFYENMNMSDATARVSHSVKYTGNMNLSDATARVSHSVKYTGNSTDSSVNLTFRSNTSSSLPSSMAYVADTLPVSSSAIEKNTGNSKSSPYEFSTRPKADGYVVNIGCPSNSTYDFDWVSKGLTKDKPMNVLCAKKERTNQDQTKENCKLSSAITVNSKWNAFLETEHDDDDDDDVSFCEYNDTVTAIMDSKLQVMNSCSLSIAAGHLTQEKQFVDIIQKHSSVQCPHESHVHNNLDSQSSDWLKKSKLNDWLSDPVVKRTADFNSTHSVVTSKERGIFDLGLEILNEDLQL